VKAGALRLVPLRGIGHDRAGGKGAIVNRAACVSTSIILLSLSLSGCVASPPPDPIETPSLLLGQWVATGPRGEEAFLHLERDGTVVATDVPTAALVRYFSGPYSTLKWDVLSTVTGKWSSSDGISGPYVSVNFPELPGNTGAPYFLEFVDGEWRLTAEVGGFDTGLTVEFTRSDH
jgi:hypothetical protein